MSAFNVRVRAAGCQLAYCALGTDSAAVLMAAIDRHGLCAITVTPA